MYGVSIDQMRQELYDCFGSRQVATIYTAVNDYMVIEECDPKIQADPTGLGSLSEDQSQRAVDRRPGAARSGVNGATAPTGPVIPLSAVTKLVPTVGAAAGQSSGPAAVGDDLFQSGPRLLARRRPSTPSARSSEETHLPASITTGFQGAAQVFQDSLKGQGVLVLAAIFAAYRRVGHPL